MFLGLGRTANQVLVHQEVPLSLDMAENQVWHYQVVSSSQSVTQNQLWVCRLVYTSVPKPERKSKQTGPLFYRKASLSVPSSDIEPRCDREKSASTSESTAERKRERSDARQYEVGIFLLPKPGLSDEPEMKEYRCIEIPSSEYAVPQPRPQQRLQRAR